MRNMRNFSHGNYFGSIITLVLETNRRVFVECLPVWYAHVAVSMENSTQVHRVDHDRPSILRNVLAAAVSSPPLLGRPFCKQVEKKRKLEIDQIIIYYLILQIDFMRIYLLAMSRTWSDFMCSCSVLCEANDDCFVQNAFLSLTCRSQHSLLIWITPRPLTAISTTEKR